MVSYLSRNISSGEKFDQLRLYDSLFMKNLMKKDIAMFNTLVTILEKHQGTREIIMIQEETCSWRHFNECIRHGFSNLLYTDCWMNMLLLQRMILRLI